MLLRQDGKTVDPCGASNLTSFLQLVLMAQYSSKADRHDYKLNQWLNRCSVLSVCFICVFDSDKTAFSHCIRDIRPLSCRACVRHYKGQKRIRDCLDHWHCMIISYTWRMKMVGFILGWMKITQAALHVLSMWGTLWNTCWHRFWKNTPVQLLLLYCLKSCLLCLKQQLWELKLSDITQEELNVVA